jgi:Phosphotransacetylase
MRTVRLGAGMAFWGDSVRPAIDMVSRGEIDYLCCDHLAELTMSILSKQRRANPDLGYTRDVVDLMRGALRTCVDRGIKIVTNAGGANPVACAHRIAEVAKELGIGGLRIAVVTGDDILPRIDELVAAGVSFTNLDTGEELEAVRDRLTHANVYTGAEGIVAALGAGADVVVCGRVTDIALYLGPLIHEFGWAPTDWEVLGRATAAAHAVECGGQATGGLYAGGWQSVDGLEELGYPIAEVSEDGSAVITKTPGSGGRVDVGTVSEQMVYEILDPANYLTADVTADLSGITLTQEGPDRVRIGGVTGRPRPDTLKVNMGYQRGFIGETVFTYSWPDAYAKAQRGIEFLRRRLERANFVYEEDIVEYLGYNSMFGRRLPEPDDPELPEIVVRYAARCRDEIEARKVFTECVPLYNNGPAGVAGVGTRPRPKELFAIWPCLIPREHVTYSVDLLEV